MKFVHMRVLKSSSGGFVAHRIMRTTDTVLPTGGTVFFKQAKEEFLALLIK